MRIFIKNFITYFIAFIYRAIWYLLVPFVYFYFLFRSIKEPGYENGFIFGPSEIIKSNNSDASALDVDLRNKYSKYGNINEIHVINMAEEGGRFWRESVPHLIVDIYNFEKTLKLKNSILVNEQESRKLIFSGLLGIEARSIFVLSKTLDL